VEQHLKATTSGGEIHVVCPRSICVGVYTKVLARCRGPQVTFDNYTYDTYDVTTVSKLVCFDQLA
jgi:hypothetical protein